MSDLNTVITYDSFLLNTFYLLRFVQYHTLNYNCWFVLLSLYQKTNAFQLKTLQKREDLEVHWKLSPDNRRDIMHREMLKQTQQLSCNFCVTSRQRLCLCAPLPPFGVSASPLCISLPCVIRGTQQQTELYANTKSHNALHCFVLTFVYLNGVF